MALNGIPIDENLCIGDSLAPINNAFLELDDRTLNSLSGISDLTSLVNANSAEWGNDIDTGLRALSANWQSTFTNVKANSAEWGTTDLTTTYTPTNVTINSSAGTDAGISAANATSAGVMTAADRIKLDSIQAGGEVNVQSNWTETNSALDSFILNKPVLGTASSKDAPSSGNASTAQVVMGNDSRLTDARTPVSHTHSTNDLTDTLSVSKGGTGTTTHTSGEVLIGNGTGAVATISRSGIDTRSTFPATAHTHSTNDLTSGTLSVPRGGTGAATHTSGEVLIGNGTGAVTTASRSGIDTRSTFPATAHTHSTNDLTDTLSVSKGGTGTTTHTSGQVLIGNGNGAVTTASRSGIDTRSTFPATAHTHSTTDITSGTLSVPRGGTGTATHTSGEVLIGNGTGAVTTISRSGIDTRSSFPATAHTHSTNDLTSGTLPITRGGTGATTSVAAMNNLAPSQAGHTGKFLQTDGSGNLSWATAVTQAVGTNIGSSRTAQNVSITSSTGTGTTIPGATQSVAGIMTSSDKYNLDDTRTTVTSNSAIWATNSGVTNLTNTPTSTTVTINSSTGTNTTVAAATTSNAGVMTAADKAKLNGIEPGAGSNVLSDWNTTDPSSGSYILNKPVLGTASGKNVPSSGNASTTQVVMGNDTRLTDSRTPVSHTHSATDITSGTLSVPRGGTGTTSHTSGQVLIGNGTGAVTTASRSGIDTRPAFPAAAHTHSTNDLTGTLSVSKGGTGTTSHTSGQVLIGNGTGAVTTASRSGIDTRSAFPATAHAHSASDITSGTLPIARGGTGATSRAAALTNLAPSQSGQAGKFLQTDGAGNISWASATIPAQATNLTTSYTSSNITVNSSTGTNATVAAATTSNAGVMSAADKTKLNGIQSGAEANVRSDWNTTSTTSDSYILNKPTLGTASGKNVPSSGNASATEVVLGNDSRLTNSRTPVSHTHSANDITSGTLPVTRGGTGATTSTAALNNLLPSQTNNAGKVLTTNGASSYWAPASDSGGTVTELKIASGEPLLVQYASTTPTMSVKTIPISKGGTGSTTSTDAFKALAPSVTGKSGKYLKTDGTNITWESVTAGVGTVTNVSGTSPISVASGTSTPTISLGTVPVNKGGTGATTSAAAFTSLAPSQTNNSGKFLATDGTNAYWATPSLAKKTILTYSSNQKASNNWNGAVIVMTNSSTATITLPTGGQEGVEFTVIRTNKQVKFVAASGVTMKTAPINTYDTLAYTNSVAGAICIGNNTWHLFGDLLTPETAS